MWERRFHPTTPLVKLYLTIRDTRPFCRPLFCHSSVVKYTSSLLQLVAIDCETSIPHITKVAQGYQLDPPWQASSTMI